MTRSHICEYTNADGETWHVITYRHTPDRVVVRDDLWAIGDTLDDAIRRWRIVDEYYRRKREEAEK